jgi:hypothetical protein
MFIQYFALIVCIVGLVIYCCDRAEAEPKIHECAGRAGGRDYVFRRAACAVAAKRRAATWTAQMKALRD